MPYYLYIARCIDNSLYTGITSDIQKRIVAHNSGQGAKYTNSRQPVKLVYQEECGSKSEALKREIKIKSWSKRKKEELIKS